MGKFESSWAEHLWKLSRETWQAAELGEAESFGWYAFFPKELSILHEDSLGFVWVKSYASDKECRKAWKGLRQAWYVFQEDEQDSLDEYEFDLESEDA